MHPSPAATSGFLPTRKDNTLFCYHRPRRFATATSGASFSVTVAAENGIYADALHRPVRHGRGPPRDLNRTHRLQKMVLTDDGRVPSSPEGLSEAFELRRRLLSPSIVRNYTGVIFPPTLEVALVVGKTPAAVSGRAPLVIRDRGSAGG